jgi:hypothetical protein
MQTLRNDWGRPLLPSPQVAVIACLGAVSLPEIAAASATELPMSAGT